MSKYWGRNRWYYILRPYVDHIARSSFASIEVEGSVLDDGRAVIFAPNHTNTLLDPLVLLQHFPRKAILFGARADIFNKPLAAKLLHFLYMVPLARERDGRSSVEKNLEVFPVIIDVLKDGIPFCLFPEGAHKLKHTLRPLRKGTQRIAFENAAVQPTCVVPVGLEYSDFLTFRGRCKMRFGEPIDVNGFIEAHKDDLKSDQYEAFGDLLWNRMAGLINYIPEDENYEKRLDETMPVPPRPWWCLCLPGPGGVFLWLSLPCPSSWSLLHCPFLCGLPPRFSAASRSKTRRSAIRCVFFANCFSARWCLSSGPCSASASCLR